ncbi:MAG: response regulator [Sphingomonadales bacterium]|nr:response regulator [Sphingomonadales bacterium]
MIDEANEIADLGILIVEDSREMRKILQGMLTELGINQVFLAKDGVEALLFLGDCYDMIDIVVADWNMPNMDGSELLRQIRGADPDIPFMMITGRADKDSVVEAKSQGVSSYIAKPFSIEQLEKKLNVLSRMLNAKVM